MMMQTVERDNKQPVHFESRTHNENENIPKKEHLIKDVVPAWAIYNYYYYYYTAALSNTW